MFVKFPAAALDPPITVPSIVPPFQSPVVIAPMFDHVAPLAVGLPPIVGDVPNTKAPYPVSFVTLDAMFADVIELVNCFDPFVATKRLAVSPEMV